MGRGRPSAPAHPATGSRSPVRSAHGTPLAFALQFLVLFGASIPFYLWLNGRYVAMVAGAVDKVLMWSEIAVRVGDEGRWHVHVAHAPPLGALSFSTGGTAYNLHTFLGIALVSALLAATPVGFLHRARLWASGCFILFGFHVLGFAASFEAMTHLCARPDADPCGVIPDMLTQLFHGAAIVVWGVLTWSVWFPSTKNSG